MATPLPEGFVLEDRQPNGLPEGFVLENVAASPPPPPGGPPSLARDLGMSVASGGVRGAVGTAAMPFDFLSMIAPYVSLGSLPFFPGVGRIPGAPQQAAAPSGTSQDINSILRSAGAGGVVDYRPQTAPGRYAQAGAEWAVPSLLAGPGGLLRRAATGAASGMVGEGAASNITPMVPEGDRAWVDPLVRTAAGIGAMGLLNRPMAQRANPSNVVADATDTLTPADWQRARDRMNAAQALGIRILPAEALGERGAALQGLTSDVAASRFGSPITQAVEGRRGQVLNAAENQVAGFGGPNRQDIANVVRDVSAGARGQIQAARTTRTLAAGPGYAAAAGETVQPGSFRVQFNNAGATISPTGPLADELRGLMAEVNGAQNMAQVDSVYRRIRNMATEAFAADPSSERGAMLRRLAEGINTQLISQSPGIAAGRAAYRQHSPAVDELRRPEVMGQLQKALMEEGTIEAALNRQLNTIFGETARPQQINRIFAELRFADNPQAARDLGAVLLRREIEQAAPRAATNMEQAGTGARITARLTETDNTAARVESIVRNMAQASGMNPDQTWTGFQRMLDVFGQTNRIPAAGSRTAPREALARSMGSNWVSTLLDTFNVTRGSLLRNASTAMAENTARADYRALAQALSQPNGLATLQQMAGQFPGSPRSRALAAQFLEAGRQTGQAAGQ
mgnify:CR=1 FL=1